MINRQAPSGIVPRPVLWVSSLSYGSVLIAGGYYQIVVLGAGVGSGRLWAFLGMLMGLLVLERLGEGASHRRSITLLVARMAAFEIVAMVDPSGFSRILYLLVPFNAYFCLGKRASYGLGLFYLTAYVVRLSINVPGWHGSREHLASLLMFAIGLIFTTAMARVAIDAEANRKHAEHLLAELATSHQQLTSYAEQIAELAAAEERNRLARDIHDCLGHYLMVVSVQLEKAIAFQQRAPQETEQALWHAREAARQAIQEVRQSVSSLRHSAELFSLSRSLAELARCLGSEQLDLDLEIIGDEIGVPQLVLMSLYRAAQEALTNVQKHAQASQARLHVRFEPHEIRLSVADNGRGFDPAMLDDLPARRQAHFGLQGIRERLAFIEGAMSVLSCPNGGTSLQITIPRNPSTLRLAAARNESVL